MKRNREDNHQIQENSQERVIMNKYGDGVAWRRGAMLGKGSFGSVYLAIGSRNRGFPLAMAVKSAEFSVSDSIQKEKEILSCFKDCPNIIQCFGEEMTFGDDDKMMAYNLLLEYASGGTLADRIKKSCHKGLPESEVRCFTRSILQGLNYIHEVGYVHCDLKPENILLMSKSRRGSIPKFTAKICDFGLAKRVRVDQQKKRRKLEPYWRGTPMYLSPEAVRDGVQETPSDIWSLGCIVLEMLMGIPAWNVEEAGPNSKNILRIIGEGKAVPKIPGNLSMDAKSFLKCCLKRMVKNRLSAKTLLNHPFVQEDYSDQEEVMHPRRSAAEEYSVSHLFEEQSCCTQIPTQYRPQYPVAFTLAAV